ncbi:MAG: cysteine desulfurase family protein [Pseudomonadota bacterium]
MTRRIYLDHNATSPLRPEAKASVVDCLDRVGNASSIHAEGRMARRQVEAARENVAQLINANPQNIIFTSGGTEANMMVLSPSVVLANRKTTEASVLPMKIFVSAIEHPCVLSGGRFDPSDVIKVPVTKSGTLDVQSLRHLLESHYGPKSDNSEPKPFTVSVMLANNETGAIQPISEISEIVRSYGGLLHTDAVQAAGKIPIDVETLGADFLTLSAHKIGGPQGVGALILCADNLVLGPSLMRGGGQELKRRAGTENVAGLAGFGAATKAAHRDLADMARIAKLRHSLEQHLQNITPNLVIFAEDTERLANTICLAAPGLSAEFLLIALDLEHISVSSGSACSSGKVDRSHVLDAMAVPADLGNGAIRISLGWNTSEQDIQRFVQAWSKIYHNFKQKSMVA